MVKLVVKRFERRLEISEVHDPAKMRVNVAADMQLDPERMPMQASALMPIRDVRKPVRRLDGEGLEDVHAWNCTLAFPAPIEGAD